MPSTFDPIYRPENVPLFEAIYGKNLISLGGTAAIDNMFSDLKLRDSLKALDIGFGLGGVAFYLAKTYHIKISGIEIHPWMVEYAKAHASKDITTLLDFHIYKPGGVMPFDAGSFDLVYSKGVLNHVREKQKLFEQINKVLKPGGLFVIADWIYSEDLTDNSSPLVNETKNTYQRVLEQTGFDKISFRDDSKIFINYINQLLERIHQSREYIEKEFGKEIFSKTWNDHQKLIDQIIHKHKFATRIIAAKK